MKRLFLWLLAILSGLYLLILGPLIDPLPFLDEAAALAVFAFVMRALGYDVARWIPILRNFKGREPSRNPGGTPPSPGRPRPKPAERPDEVIDV
ncbi:MAG: hypothetical protein K9N23_10680 [Akkermansiaceae bacterium]|nr:hypothetical protein [Akkermansiaceae bacterium]